MCPSWSKGPDLRSGVFSHSWVQTPPLANSFFIFYTFYTYYFIEKISFIGHSLGGILARYIVQHNSFAPLRYYCDTYISLSTPHLGSLYGTQLTGAGMKIYRFVKKLEALNELEFADSANIQDTFLYYLNQQPSLKYFKRIILVSSPYDDYVPYSSSRIERGNLTDHNYSVMVENVLHEIPITTTLMRYDVGFYVYLKIY